MNEEYKSNSNRSKTGDQAKPKVDKVISGSAKIKKKGELRKLRDAFIPEDISNVKSYIIMDVIVPAIKKTVEDVLIDTITTVFGGKPGQRKRSGSAYVSYDRFSSDRRYSDRDRYSSTSVRGLYDLDNIILDSRADAEKAIFTINEMIENFGVASVADLYDAIGIRTFEHTTNKYGWEHIIHEEPVRVRDGYLLRLPRPKPL